jgi:hypothetical protein
VIVPFLFMVFASSKALLFTLRKNLPVSPSHTHQTTRCA